LRPDLYSVVLVSVVVAVALSRMICSTSLAV
jgi:hypothetical protein